MLFSKVKTSTTIFVFVARSLHHVVCVHAASPDVIIRDFGSDPTKAELSLGICTDIVIVMMIVKLGWCATSHSLSSKQVPGCVGD